MNKENILYSIIGLLLGYVAAFTFVIYVNQREAAGGTQTAGGAQVRTNAPGGGADDEEIRERIREAGARARENAGSFDLQMEAAELHARAGEFEEAIDFLTRANELRPEDYEVIVGLGNINYEAGRFEVAERWYREALRRKPDDINVRTDLGLTFFLRKPSDIDGAVAEFRQSLQRDPRHELTLQNMTVVLTRKASIEDSDAKSRTKSLEEAEQNLSQLEEVNPDNPALPNLREAVRKARTSLSPSAGAGDKSRS